MKTPIHVFDNMTPELRALANEYGLENLVQTIETFKTEAPERLEALLKRNQKYTQEKTAIENKNLGLEVREAMKKGK